VTARARTLLLACLLLVVTATEAALRGDRAEYAWDGQRFRIPLEVRETAGVDRDRWPFTSGVPFPPGVLNTTDRLRVTDAQGLTVPCEFHVLSRHAGRDNSVRWLLLDCQLDIRASERKQLFLDNAGDGTPLRPGIRVSRTSEGLNIDNGLLQLDLKRGQGVSLGQVRYQGRALLDSGHDAGLVLSGQAVDRFRHFTGKSWNTHGWSRDVSEERASIPARDYRARIENLEVEQQGPLHLVVRLEGDFLPLDGSAPLPGFYRHTTRIHVHANSPLVRVESSLENSERRQPQWMYPLTEARLELPLALEGTPEAVVGHGDDHIAVVARSLEALQGTPREVRQGRKRFAQPGRLVVTTDRGVKTSDRPLRYLLARSPRGSAGVTLRYLWQEGPRALRLRDGRLTAAFHARDPEAPEPYDLDFGERTLNDLLYFLSDGPMDPEDARRHALAFEYPLFARAPNAWYADSEVWYFEFSPDADDVRLRKRRSQGGHWVPELAGYRRFGNARGYNSGGHHESLNSAWLDALASGDPVEFEHDLATSRWLISHNPGWHYRDNRLVFGEGEARLEALDRQLDAWNRLTAFGPKDFHLWGLSPKEQPEQGPRLGGTSYFNRYKWLPDHEHYALFQIFEYYYLTGDRRALDSIHGFVNWDLNFQNRHLFRGKTRPLDDVTLFERDPEAMRRGHYARVYSWMLYTNLAGLQATDSPVMDLYARWQLRRMLALLRHRHGQLTRWDLSPGALLKLLPDSLARKVSNHVDMDLLRADEDIYTSWAKTWMESQGTLALHEAYKHYDDERILDGLWGQGDYFAHHVLFYPRLAMVNQITHMPNALLGIGPRALNPQRHDRHVQMWPVLFHYSGWQDVLERYRAFEKFRNHSPSWFTQTLAWEQKVRPKRSHQPPERVTDLAVEAVDGDGITLVWTSPADDGPTGRASRYFVKISRKPIVAWAPTDHPDRAAAKARIVAEVEAQVLGDQKKRRRSKDRYEIDPKSVQGEDPDQPRAHPDWHRVNAFWMAEHVAGEPQPGPAGSRERFRLTRIRPHTWFGLDRDQPITELAPGTWYVALCSWDSDRNLSELSNVVEFEWR